MSKRQDRKATRAGKKDKNGIPLTLSRPQRRAASRLNRGISHYNAFPKSPESGQGRQQPGSQQHW
jgi:hypothetical protein